MGSIAYSAAQKAEAIALGVVIGADAASKRLGMQADTIRKWMARAGRAPADAISAADWQSLGELARTQVQADLASGKVSTIQAATIAGIASRNAVLVPPPSAPPTDAETWGARIEAALDAQYGKDADLAMLAALDWMDSDDPEGAAPTVADVMTYLASLDLHEWRTARDAASRQDVADQLALNRLRAEESRRAAMDAEERAGVEAAERIVAEAYAALAETDER